MGKLVWTALGAAALAGCSGGGGGTGSSGGGSDVQQGGMLQLLSHEPLDGAVQVPVDASLVLRFDARIAAECLADVDTWLHKEPDGAAVEGSFAFADGGRTAVFTPAAPLQAETDYLLQLSPLTCDESGRILEFARQVRFRTFDATPPAVLAASFGSGQTGVSRTLPLQVTFSEAVLAASIDANTVYLRDVFGTTYPALRTLAGDRLSLQPLADLPGDRGFVLAVTGGVRDRAGNRLPQTWSSGFRTAADTVEPQVLSVWPSSGSSAVSPLVQPSFGFSESMDPYSVEPSSLLFQDEFASVVPFRVHASADQRQLRIEPLVLLQPGRRYTLGFLLGPAAATDVSGNGLSATTALVFTTGSDTDPPQLLNAAPGDGAEDVSVNAVPVLTFAEPLAAEWVDGVRVRLLQDERDVGAVVEPILAGSAIRVTPVLPLQPGGRCRLLLAGGHQGLHDLAGNPLAQDLELGFTVADDATPPQLLLQPGDGATGVPLGAAVVLVCDQPLQPATVHAGSVEVLDAMDAAVPGSVQLLRGGRVVRFLPHLPWTPGAWYRTVVHSGPDGVRELSGNWLAEDLRARFRAGFANDLLPPVCDVTVNGIDAARKSRLCLPPNGFTIDITASDPTDQSLDMGSIAVQLDGPGPAPDSDQVFVELALDGHAAHYRLPPAVALQPGAWTLTVGVSDLSGNRASSAQLAFEVVAPSAEQLPFERTQVVWVRADLDRDGNGTPDFDDDLLRLGLLAAGDPAGTNARMRQLLLDGMLAQASALLHRGSRGEPLGPDSVPLRFTTRQPLSLPHMQMALGGFDPEGARGRRFGDSSTGILGRALYDYRNSSVNERNTAMSPGLGVFPAEMFLFQARIHAQVYPGFSTMWAQRFLPLCPDLQGTPAGAGPLDGTVLAANFDYSAAGSQARARFNQVFAAADDWAAVIGIILAHEVGHSVGLVAPGDAPSGLFGDASLHDSNASAAEVMAAAVGYEAMLTLSYRFRDVDLAYLRQRLVLR